MEFIDFEAEIIDNFSRDNENQKDDIADKIFNNDGDNQDVSVNFYSRFHNQTRDIFDAVNDHSDDNCKLDKRTLQPEMYWEIDRSFAQFDEFDGWEESAKKLKKKKKTLCTFQINSPDSFYNAILYGLIFKLSKNEQQIFNENKIEQIIGKQFINSLKDRKKLWQLELSLCNFEKKCYIANQFLMEQNLFLPVCEQRDKFCFVIKKDVQGKNKVIHHLSSCIIKNLMATTQQRQR